MLLPPFLTIAAVAFARLYTSGDIDPGDVLALRFAFLLGDEPRLRARSYPSCVPAAKS